jgi:hypothetical protein
MRQVDLQSYSLSYVSDGRVRIYANNVDFALLSGPPLFLLPAGEGVLAPAIFCALRDYRGSESLRLKVGAQERIISWR